MYTFPHKLVPVILGALGLIFADTALGIALSIKQKTFDVRKLPQFLETAVAPYAIGLGGLFISAPLNAGIEAAFATATAAVGAKTIADITDKVTAWSK